LKAKLLSALLTQKLLPGASIFVLAIVLLVLALLETVDAQEEPKWDIYLCIDVSQSVLPDHLNKMKDTLEWIFNNKLRDGKNGDRVAIVLFGENAEIFHPLREMEERKEEKYSKEGDIPKGILLQKILDEFKKVKKGSNEIPFSDSLASGKSLIIGTRKTQFQEVAHALESLIQSDEKGSQETEKRLPVVMFLTDGEQDINDMVSPSTEIHSVDLFTRSFDKLSLDENKKYACKFVFFIVSHSKGLSNQSIQDIKHKWDEAFALHKGNFKYYDRTEYDNDDEWVDKIDGVFKRLRFVQSIEFSVKGLLTCFAGTSQINPIELYYHSELPQDKWIRVELVPTESLQETPLGIRFPGYRMDYLINVSGKTGQSRVLLPFQMAGAVPEYLMSQKLTLRFSTAASTDTETEWAIQPNVLQIPISITSKFVQSSSVFKIIYHYKPDVPQKEIEEDKKIKLTLLQISSGNLILWGHYRPISDIPPVTVDSNKLKWEIPPHSYLIYPSISCRINPIKQESEKEAWFEKPFGQIYGGVIYFTDSPSSNDPSLPVTEQFSTFLRPYFDRTKNKMEFAFLVQSPLNWIFAGLHEWFKFITATLLIGAVIIGSREPIVRFFRGNSRQKTRSKKAQDKSKPDKWVAPLQERVSQGWQRVREKENYNKFMVVCGACLFVFGYLRYNPGQLIYPSYFLFPRMWDGFGLVLLVTFGAPLILPHIAKKYKGKRSLFSSGSSLIVGMAILWVADQAVLAVLGSFISQIVIETCFGQ